MSGKFKRCHITRWCEQGCLPEWSYSNIVGPVFDRPDVQTRRHFHFTWGISSTECGAVCVASSKFDRYESDWPVQIRKFVIRSFSNCFSMLWMWRWWSLFRKSHKRMWKRPTWCGNYEFIQPNHYRLMWKHGNTWSLQLNICNRE